MNIDDHYEWLRSDEWDKEMREADEYTARINEVMDDGEKLNEALFEWLSSPANEKRWVEFLKRATVVPDFHSYAKHGASLLAILYSAAEEYCDD